MSVEEDPFSPELLRKKARVRAVEMLDMAWAEEALPNMTDTGRLMAMHRARYEGFEFDTMLRLDSAEWLRTHGYAVLPEGRLP